MDWSITPHSPQGGHAAGSASPSPLSRINRTVSSWLVLRGQGAGGRAIAQLEAWDVKR